MFGWIRIDNLGFPALTLFSILLSVTPFTGGVGALWLVAIHKMAASGDDLGLHVVTRRDPALTAAR